MISEYLEEVRKALDEVEQQGDQLKKAAREIADHSSLVLTIGNGGSSSTAQHLAQGLCDAGRRAICLTDNSSLLTALSNDYSYEEALAKQVETFNFQTSLVVAISASGLSPNILRGVEAIRYPSRRIGLIGFGGGILQYKVGIPIVLSSRDYGVVEDVHLVISHLICRLVRNG